MAGLWDKQIAEQEARDKQYAAEQLAEFRTEHAGKFVDVFLGLAGKKE